MGKRKTKEFLCSHKSPGQFWDCGLPPLRCASVQCSFSGAALPLEVCSLQNLSCASQVLLGVFLLRLAAMLQVPALRGLCHIMALLSLTHSDSSLPCTGAAGGLLVKWSCALQHSVFLSGTFPYTFQGWQPLLDLNLQPSNISALLGSRIPLPFQCPQAGS